MDNEELRLQQKCYRMLSERGIFAHSCPNEADGRSVRTQSQLVGAGLTSGVADMVVWWATPDWIRNGNLPSYRMQPFPREIGYVEFKTPKGRQSDNQKTFQSFCEACGIEYVVIHSVEEMEALIWRHLNG